VGVCGMCEAKGGMDGQGVNFFPQMNPVEFATLVRAQLFSHRSW
jgi:hypothetical protein